MIHIISAAFGYDSAAADAAIYTREYFPLNSDKILVYESSFGEMTSRSESNGNEIILSNISDDFKYIQNFEIVNDSVFLTRTEQAVDVFLFISTESIVTYSEPALRIPFPLRDLETWIWEGYDIHETDTNQISFKGKVLGTDTVTVAAGTFETLNIEIRVESKTGTNSRILEWLAPGIGVVKEVVYIEGGGMSGFFRDILGYDEIYFELTRVEPYR